jgi:hypothetical protein
MVPSDNTMMKSDSSSQVMARAGFWVCQTSVRTRYVIRPDRAPSARNIMAMRRSMLIRRDQL